MKIYKLLPLLLLITSNAFAVTYTGTKPKDLDVTTPTEANTKISEFNNSDREIKTVITNLENITTVTGTYTVAGTQTGILGSSTAGFTISFPAASTLATGMITKRYMIKNINAGTITLNLTVDGVGSPTVTGSQSFKLFTDGTSWFEEGANRAAIASNALLFNNLPDTYYTNATNIATGTVNLDRLPGTLTGKSADMVDGYHAGTSATTVLVLDGSGLVPLANIPTTLTGKDADSVDSIDGTNIVQTSRTVSTTSPLAGGGALSSNLTLSMPLATSGQNGYISSADWTTFNNKVSSSVTINTTAPITGGGDLSASRTLSMATATASVPGYLGTPDFNAFNNKANVVAGSGITSSSTTGTTTITNNGVLQILAGTGISISSNGTGSPTITASGTATAGGWTDTGTSTVATAGYQVIVHGTLTVDAVYGVTGLLDRDIPDNVTLTNLTQITTRNYDDLSGTSTIKPTQIAIGTSTLQGALNTVGSATFSGTVTAGGFSGSGAGLTNLPPDIWSAIIGSATENAQFKTRIPTANKILVGLPQVFYLAGTETTQTPSGDNSTIYDLITPTFLLGSNTVFTDSSSSNHTMSSFGNVQLSDVNQKMGGSSLLCDGTGDYLTTAAHADWNFSTNNWTWETWAKSTVNGLEVFLGWGTGNNMIGKSSDGTATLYLISTGTNSATIASGAALGGFGNSSFRHVSLSRQGDNLRGYVDGVQGGTWSVAGRSFDYSSSALTIGIDNSLINYPWNGNVDELRISNTARYTENFTPQTTVFTSDANTLLLMHYDNGSAYNQRDIIVNNNVGEPLLRFESHGTATVKKSYTYIPGSVTVFGGTSSASIGTSTPGLIYGLPGKGAATFDAFNVHSINEIKTDVASLEGTKTAQESLEKVLGLQTFSWHPKIRNVERSIAEDEAKLLYLSNKYSQWETNNKSKYVSTVFLTGTGSSEVLDSQKMIQEYNTEVAILWASDLKQDILIQKMQNELESDMSITRIGMLVSDPQTPAEIKERDTINLMSAVTLSYQAIKALNAEIGSLTALLNAEIEKNNEEIDNLYNLVNAIIAGIVLLGGSGAWVTMRRKRKGA